MRKHGGKQETAGMGNDFRFIPGPVTMSIPDELNGAKAKKTAYFKKRGIPMPQTTPKKTGRATNASNPPGNEVLTLKEAADFLRVSEAEVIRLVQHQNLPGRLLGAEWRFLKSSLENWLESPPRRGSKEAVLSVAGAWKDDPYLEEELKEIFKQRGRPMTEDGE